jgi:hypothetical protein
VSATWWAIVLARDIDTCCALVRGEPVDPASIDKEWLELAKHFELVRLDTTAADLLARRAQLRRLLREAA